ncbi:hypothetical protein HY605_05840 [Candidatus Peregrinibacteria bacterium]|nr:hypothetical protein [Candidatus Peregrinibacteria bacterium]
MFDMREMKYFSQHKKLIQRIAGILFIILSFTVVWFWFFRLVPIVRRYDPCWYEQFTQKAYWKAIQDNIRRHGWTHDDRGPIGLYGDKQWARWIMARAERGEIISECGNIGHKDAALEFITNHNPAKGKEGGIEKEWLQWWSKNKDKSQLEWIKDGFVQYGVQVHIPPEADDWEPLLVLLGNTGTNEANKIPSYVKYNAYRWLRDSGFDPIVFAISNVNVSTPDVVRQGLFEYSKYFDIFPKRDQVGILPFRDEPKDDHDNSRPVFFDFRFQAVGYSLMIFPILLGAALLVLSNRKKQNVEQKNAPDKK